jgi:hypothetical protein
VFIGCSAGALTGIVADRPRLRRRGAFRYISTPERRKIPGSAQLVQPTRRRAGIRALLAAAAGTCALAVLAAFPPPAAAEEATAPPTVDLDRLLRLPQSLDLEPAARGSATKAEWRERFDTARSELAEARAALAETQAKVAEVAGETSAWQMSAPGIGGLDPGAGTRDGPLDYDLSNEMRRNRREVARAERRLSELEIEANLAGVPEDWRGSQASDAASAAQPAE